MFVLVVDIHVKSEHRDAFIAAITENAAASSSDAEPECIRFEVVQDNDDPDRFTLYEVYERPESLDAHRETPHFKKYFAAAGDLMAEPPSRRAGTMLYSPLA